MDQREKVERIAARTLIIAGSKDPATPVEHLGFLHARIAGSRFQLLETAHLSNVERPAEFSAAILEFLRGDETAAGGRS
jgi:3-oxoadipate enol-lactonase